MFYSHLDTQWRWDYPHTVKEYILNTMRDNFKLLEKYDNYVFNFSGANRYKYMKEYYPDDYEKVKKHISDGRWFPCGSSVEENDVLVPSVESIIRQILYGNDYFKKEFGKDSKEYMLPDCFGFPASLPSILAHCGLDGFSTQKLTWGSAKGIPFNLGFWVGPDNKSILAAFNPGDYITQVKEDLSNNEKWLKRIKELGEQSGIFMEYMYVGTGDWGGAPNEDSVKSVEDIIKSSGSTKIVPSAADKFFIDVKSQDTSKLPVFRGELLLTNHSAGSLTSQAYIKRWNRKNELLASAAESAAVIGNCINGIRYPKAKLNEAWRLFQSAQFHDILPGTCIPKAYEYSWNDQLLALNQFADVLTCSVNSIASLLDTKVDGIPLVIYNPLSFERNEVIEASITFNDNVPNFLKVFDKNNKEVPSQIKEIKDNKVTYLFAAWVPSLGLSVYNVKISEEPCKMRTDLHIEDNKIENETLVVQINKNGDISRIFDKINNREVLSNPVRLAFLHERPKEYPAWNMDWADREKEPVGFVKGEAKIRIKEIGPVRVALQVERESGGSLFIQNLSLTYISNYLTVENEIDWFTKESSLKALFPLTVSNPNAVYNMGLGKARRGNNDPQKFEVPSHQWFDLTDINGDYGVTIFEDSKYGSDKPTDNILRLTLLYTPGVRSDFKDQATQDLGKHEFKFAIYPHSGNWQKAKSEKNANAFNQPLIPFVTTPHHGILGKSFSFISFNNDDITISALKLAENSDDIILRVIETKGQSHEKIELKTFLPIINVIEVTGQENCLKECALENNCFRFDIESHGIKTFAIKFTKNSGVFNLPLSIPIELPYNIKAFSKDKEKIENSFDDNERTYPFELMPQLITDNEIDFKLGTAFNNSFDALSCNGQELTLADGNCEYLYLLAASNGADTECSLIIDDKENKLSISSWTGFIGQWDKRLWNGIIHEEEPDYYWGDIDYIGLEPGYIKRDNVACFSTHIHDKNGNNIPYSYGYLFKYKIPLPNNITKIRLPKNKNIIIFAATLSKNETINCEPACFLYDRFDRINEDYSRYQVCIKPKIETESFIVEPDKTLPVKLKTDELNSEIRYTLDGSEPTAESRKYDKLISISESVILKAATFKSGKGKSEIISHTFYSAYKIQGIKYLTEYSPKYAGKGDNTLINSRRASSSLLDKEWIGYEVNDLDVILDMGKELIFNKLKAGFLSNNSSWIFLPTNVKAFVSDDGNSFTEAASVDIAIPEKDGGMWVENVELNMNHTKGRYIRLVAKNLSKCPDWHHGAVGNVWLFIDQIIVE